LTGFIKKYPIRGQLLISGTIAWASDTTLQLAKNEPFDFTRNLRFTSTFLFFLAPANLIWFRFLDAKKLSPVLCVIADAIIFYPSALITLITINNFLKVNLTFEKKSKKINSVSDFLEILVPAWCFWIPVQFLNFSFTPLNYRLIVVQVAAYLFNMFLSFKIN
jgi:protein Mpv17